MTVYLVGAGPGDPGLLTVRADEVLRRADVVVYDRLSVEALLELAPPHAERISVGKAPGRVTMPQADINALLVERGRAGGTVVRLKGGDPFVFARGGEEAGALAEAGVPFEIVPGITSAIAVPAYAGIPVTLRHSSTSFTVVTGHEDPAAGDAGSVDWRAVAAVGGTIVILMGVARIGRIAEELVAGGLAPDTPGGRRAVGNASGAGDGAGHARDDRFGHARNAIGDRGRGGGGRRSRLVRAATVVRSPCGGDADARAGVGTLAGAARGRRGAGRDPGDRDRRRCRWRRRPAISDRHARVLRLDRGHVPERRRTVARRPPRRRARRPRVRRRPRRGHRSRHRRRAGRRGSVRRPRAAGVRRRVAARCHGGWRLARQGVARPGRGGARCPARRSARSRLGSRRGRRLPHRAGIGDRRAARRARRPPTSSRSPRRPPWSASSRRSGPTPCPPSSPASVR